MRRRLRRLRAELKKIKKIRQENPSAWCDPFFQDAGRFSRGVRRVMKTCDTTIHSPGFSTAARVRT
jgi:hypothetical protein